MAKYISGCRNRHFKGINLCVEPLHVATVNGTTQVTVMLWHGPQIDYFKV